VKNDENKIVIFSVEDDVSTTKVMRWMNYLDSSINIVRLHPSDFYESEIEMIGILNPITIKMKRTMLSTDKISVVWMRKWGKIKFLDNVSDKLILNNLSQISANLHEEFCGFFDFLIFKIEQNKNTLWLNKPSFNSPNKLKQLLIADQLGLKTPFTILNTKLNFDYSNQNIITKPISDCVCLFNEKDVYCNYTSRVSKNEFAKDFFVSLFQREIHKELELRVFFIDGQCYTMAIFSQNNSRTEVDYRNYDNINPSREEYYELPQNVCSKISFFMKEMNLQTGSLDFILDTKGEYVFLEVNPCGQYDIFNSCNVYPDKLIAESLIKKHYEYNQKNC